MLRAAQKQLFSHNIQILFACLSVDGVDELIDGKQVEQAATEKFEFENHDVFVNTEVNFEEAGFLSTSAVVCLLPSSFFQIEHLSNLRLL